MVSRTIGNYSLNGNKEAITVAELIQKLHSREIVSLQNGNYRFEGMSSTFKIHCPVCQNSGFGNNSQFDSIGVFGGFKVYKFSKETAEFQGFLKHSKLPPPGSPCVNPVGNPIISIKYDPLISVGDSGNNTLQIKMSRPSLDKLPSDTEWDSMIETVRKERGGLISSDDKSALFEWSTSFTRLKIPDLDGETFRLPPFDPGKFQFWKYITGSGTLVPIITSSKKLEIPGNADILMQYQDCSCRDINPGHKCDCEIDMGFNKFRPLHFSGLPSPLILFEQPNKPEGRENFESLLEKIFNGQISPYYTNVAFWIEYNSGNVSNGTFSSTNDCIDFVFGIHSKEDQEVRAKLTSLDSLQDQRSQMLSELDVSDKDDMRVYSAYEDPEEETVSCEGGKTKIFAMKTSGTGILSIEAEGRTLDSFTIKTTRNKRGLERLRGADESNLFKEIKLDFDDEQDAYGGDFEKMVWDYLRASQSESIANSNAQSPFKATRTSRRLNQLRNLIPELNSLGGQSSSRESLEPSSSLFLRLMELTRPKRDNPDDLISELEGNPVFGGWTNPSERAVGSEELEMCILFNHGPVRQLVERGLAIDDDEILLMKNGLRLIKTDAALRLGIPITDRLPAMDYVSEDPKIMLLSLFADTDENDKQTFRDVYSGLQSNSTNQVEFMFCGMKSTSTKPPSPSFGIWSNDLRSAPRTSRWWRRERATAIHFPSSKGVTPYLKLHRFSSLDQASGEYGSQFYLVYSRDRERMAIKIFSSGDFNPSGIPKHWVDYITSAPKSEWHIRRYDLLREVVRAFYSSSESRENTVSVSSINNQQKYLAPLLPYAVRKFFMSETSKITELEQHDSNLLKFVDSRAASQLWLSD
jgi:hypothetical protein